MTAQDHRPSSTHSTHVNAPIHLIPEAAASRRPRRSSRFFGTGVVVSITRRADLGRADRARWIWPKRSPRMQNRRHRSDQHRLAPAGYSDSQDYFGHAPGLSKQAAQWLVKKRYKLVGVDTAALSIIRSRPRLGPHRNGPQSSIPAAGVQARQVGPRRDQGFPGVERRAQGCCSAPASPPSRMSAAILDYAVGPALHLPGVSLALVRGRRLRDPAGRHPRSEG